MTETIKLSGFFNPSVDDLLHQHIMNATFKDGLHPFPFSVTIPQDIEDRDEIIKKLTEAESVSWFGTPCKVKLESIVGDKVNLMATPVEVSE